MSFADNINPFRGFCIVPADGRKVKCQDKILQMDQSRQMIRGGHGTIKLSLQRCKNPARTTGNTYVAKISCSVGRAWQQCDGRQTHRLCHGCRIAQGTKV